MEPNSSLVINNVSNITIQTALSSNAIEILCIGNNSGFVFHDIEGLTIHNFKISNCGADASKFLSKPFSSSHFFTFLFVNLEDLVLERTVIQRGRGYGISGCNILGNSTISNSRFTNFSDGGGVLLQYQDTASNSMAWKFHIRNNITIIDSQFMYSQCWSLHCSGSGLSILLMQSHFAVMVHLLGVAAMHNIAARTPAISVRSASQSPNHVIVEKCHCKYNLLSYHGGAGFQYSSSDYFGFYRGKNPIVIEIVDSEFSGNGGLESDHPLLKVPSNALAFTFFMDKFSTPHFISVRNTKVTNNIGGSGAAFYSEVIGLYEHQDNLEKITFEIKDSKFTNNTSTAFEHFKMSAVSLIGMANITIENCTFANNTGTGLLVDRSEVFFKGTTSIVGNRAYNGAGMALYGVSYIYLQLPTTLLKLESNFAENVGGGLFVAKTAETISPSKCFFQLRRAYLYSQWIVGFKFNNNSARTSGNDLYGGTLNLCQVEGIYTQGWRVMDEISVSPANYSIDISSNPSRVCHCSAEMSPDCFTFTKAVNTYPGKEFNVPVLAVGQIVNATFSLGVPSAIYASVLPLNSSENSIGIIPDVSIVQESGRACNDLTLSIRSSSENEIIVLTVEKSDQMQHINKRVLEHNFRWYNNFNELVESNIFVPIYIKVNLLPCPIGFQLSYYNVCDCAPSLRELEINCSINTELVHHKSSLWIGTKSQVATGEERNTSHIVYLTHPHCPFDYCKQGEFDFSLNNSDALCAHNRSGMLCGACKPGYSLTLGGSQCRQCSNVYLLLLIPFALAGILLVIFLSITNITVSAGTINGLLFFANVVRESQTILFPTSLNNSVLSVFIAWINLDLGVNMCFFNGLNSYVMAWLQFIFPFYIWLLAILIIIASRYFKIVNRLCGSNIVPVLATLFLLSYTKLQRAIVTGLSFTIVSASDGEEVVVWLRNGNIRYLSSKHVILFLVTAAALVLLLVPYTLSILFGPWLQSKTHYKVFSWVQRLKPLFDAYLGPYKDKYRCWTGVLLLARVLLSTLTAVNALGDTNINLFAISVVCYLLVALVWQSGGVYKIWLLSALESFFLVNLGVLALVTLYNRLSNGNQYAAMCMSIGSAMVVTFLVLIYHCYTKLPKCMQISFILRNRRATVADNRVEGRGESSDEELFNVVDRGREYDSYAMPIMETPHK